ncbi:hypothetical protein CYMTET_19829 [Cymbomonas tetramitiformis]|uniref:Uncharacterized protein n=1 Tax=Cymbomonas tetramitiformis TaxID=36881 RepID=A0AAE0G598_9CHLO|nr:hypothetical protein CYMTET_19829 [Cymbomonas tetramitiformis]
MRRFNRECLRTGFNAMAAALGNGKGLVNTHQGRLLELQKAKNGQKILKELELRSGNVNKRIRCGVSLKT